MEWIDREVKKLQDYWIEHSKHFITIQALLTFLAGSDKKKKKRVGRKNSKNEPEMFWIFC